LSYLRSIIILILFAATYFVNMAICFASEESPSSNFTGEAKVDFVNNYYWRGAYFYPEGVPAIQPNLNIGFKDPGISLNIFSSLPLTKRPELKDCRDELELILNYDLVDKDNFGISTGFISYILFAGDFWHSEEIYLSGWRSIWKGLGVYAGVFIDLDAYKGIYFNFGPSYSSELTEKLNWESKILLSFTKYSGFGFSLIETGFASSLVYQMTKTLSLGTDLLWNYNIEEAKNQYALRISVATAW
jgi:hypothetical protein